MSVEITGHMDIWTDNSKMHACSVNGFDYGKLYVCVTINHWTHGLLDTQQNNVSLFSITKVICLFKNPWTHGLLNTQQNSLCLSCIWKDVCVCLLKSLDTWTFGHTTK